MDTPFIRVEDTGAVVSLTGEVTIVGRGRSVDVRLDDPSRGQVAGSQRRQRPPAFPGPAGSGLR